MLSGDAGQAIAEHALNIVLQLCILGGDGFEKHLPLRAIASRTHRSQLGHVASDDAVACRTRSITPSGVLSSHLSQSH